MKKVIILAMTLTICACTPDKDKLSIDQCLHREIFNEMLKNGQKGPLTIGDSGDWAAVVYRLEMASRDMSTRKVEMIKPECLGKN